MAYSDLTSVVNPTVTQEKQNVPCQVVYSFSVHIIYVYVQPFEKTPRHDARTIEQTLGTKKECKLKWADSDVILTVEKKNLILMEKRFPPQQQNL